MIYTGAAVSNLYLGILSFISAFCSAHTCLIHTNQTVLYYHTIPSYLYPKFLLHTLVLLIPCLITPYQTIPYQLIGRTKCSIHCIVKYLHYTRSPYTYHTMPYHTTSARVFASANLLYFIYKCVYYVLCCKV